MGNPKLATVVEAVRANLSAAEYGIELTGQMIRDDGVTESPELQEASVAVRLGLSRFVIAIAAAGKQQAELLHDVLSERDGAKAGV